MSVPVNVTIKSIFVKEQNNPKTQNKETTAEDLLLLSDFKNLTVWRITDGKIGVRFEHCDIKEGMFLEGRYGVGDTFSEACKDYLEKIRGKTLVFNAYTDYREEISVL